MLTTKEAAEYLGVSIGRIRQLILADKLSAEKTSNGWLVDEGSLLARKDTARAGRPRKDVMELEWVQYTLMSRNHEVAHVSFNPGLGQFSRYEVLDPQRVPYALVGYEAKAGHALHNLNKWWGKRAIPNTRSEITTRLFELGLHDTWDIPLRSLGFSLSDQYWLKPRGSGLSWAQLNYFHNAYELGPVDGEDSLSMWLNAVGLSSPDNTTDGQFPKRWLIDGDGRRVLVKDGGPLGRTAINEVIATRLYQRLLKPGEYVGYRLATWRDHLVSACETFVADDEEFIPAVYIYGLAKKSNNDSQYIHYHNICERIGVPDAISRLDKMIVCDSILANTDRHWRNFGIVRNVETLQLRAAPIFDTGTSLWAQTPDYRLEKHDYAFTTKPFYQDWQRELDLVLDVRWFDPDALDGFVDEVHDLYSKVLSANCAWLIDAVCTGLAQRIEFIIKWWGKRPHPVFAGWEGPGPQEVIAYIDL